MWCNSNSRSLITVSVSPGGAGCVESRCLGRSHFSTWTIRSAALAVSKHIGKQMPFLERHDTRVDNFNLKDATSWKVQVHWWSLVKTLPTLCLAKRFHLQITLHIRLYYGWLHTLYQNIIKLIYNVFTLAVVLKKVKRSKSIKRLLLFMDHQHFSTGYMNIKNRHWITVWLWSSGQRLKHWIVTDLLHVKHWNLKHLKKDK